MFSSQGEIAEIFKPQGKPNLAALGKWQIGTDASQTLARVAGFEVSENQALPV